MTKILFATAMMSAQLLLGCSAELEDLTPDSSVGDVDGTGLTLEGPVWEQYVSDPGNTPAAELITYIFVPIK